MYLHRSAQSTRIFRTDAWKRAWLDTWGRDKRIELIDLGGNNKPHEMVYKVRQHIKKILPVDSLHLIGTGSRVLSSPRAEYNDIDGLLSAFGSTSEFFLALAKISWQQFYLPDIQTALPVVGLLKSSAKEKQWLSHELQHEPAYYVRADNFSNYCAGLGANTRLAYFNRRERLEKSGSIEFVQYPIAKALVFFAQLNQFHSVRWGRPCYSGESQAFFQNFLERLVREGGLPVMEAMQVNGEVVSVLFDIVLDGCRYNLQSGYAENRFPKLALGALHMGYAIQAAIEAGQVYDFMAGQGKNSNYKARIATHHEMLGSMIIERGVIAYARQCRKWFL